MNDADKPTSQRNLALPRRMAIATAVTAVAGYVIALFLAAALSDDSLSLWLWKHDLGSQWYDVVRTTALIVGALGLAAGVALNYSRQQTTDASLDFERGKEATRHERELATSAAQLYNSAVDQLGHDEPAVRGAAMYTLDRLGAQHPEYRQNVADIWCSYLRTPNPLVRLKRELDDLQRHLFRAETVRLTEEEVNRGMQAANSAVDEFERIQKETRNAGKRWTEADIAAEVQVRDATQRLLARRLASSESGPGWTSSGHVTDLDLADAHLHNPDFNGALFPGRTNFDRATFTGIATAFNDAAFEGLTTFELARFLGIADFRGASFAMAMLRRADFADLALFNNVTFAEGAAFSRATFHRDADFGHVQFEAGADFAETRLESRAVFEKAEFHGGAYFRAAAFCGPTNFTKARFDRSTTFDEAGFVYQPMLEDAHFENGVPPELRR